MKRNVDNRKRILTDTPMPGVPLTEIMGNRRVLIENHQGILAYGENEICVKVKIGSVRIDGARLELECISQDRVVITGQIHCVQLCSEV